MMYLVDKSEERIKPTMSGEIATPEEIGSLEFCENTNRNTESNQVENEL